MSPANEENVNLRNKSTGKVYFCADAWNQSLIPLKLTVSKT